MEDKTFELIEKMYADFSARFDKVEADISGIKSDVQALKKDALRIEQNHGNKLDALDRKEYVMWRRVDGYLSDFEFGTSAEDEFR